MLRPLRGTEQGSYYAANLTVKKKICSKKENAHKFSGT